MGIDQRLMSREENGVQPRHWLAMALLTAAWVWISTLISAEL